MTDKPSNKIQSAQTAQKDQDTAAAEQNFLYYGDNLELMRRYIASESIDLCYIDPPFNSKRNYFQIYRGINEQADRAQAQAFEDTWEWGEKAQTEYDDIHSAGKDYTRQTIELLRGLDNVLSRKGLFAYLVSMTIRLNEIWRCLKPTGSFYLHCDPTASHYLKLVLDSIYLPRGGHFRNEIIWCYAGGGIPKHDYPRKHDVILRYSKTKETRFNTEYREYGGWIQKHEPRHSLTSGGDPLDIERGTPINDWWADIKKLTSYQKEWLGYPTQKPRALLERIIEASSNEGDIVLDCYCGCGTTIDAAHKLHRRWIGMDITYYAVSLVLKRLKEFQHYDQQDIQLTGIPKDMEGASALAHNPNDKKRKEFEIWALLAFTEHNGIPNDARGADRGSDGVVYYYTDKNAIDKASLEVKSGKNITHAIVDRVASGMQGLGAPVGYLLTLAKPSKGVYAHAKHKGYYKHPVTGNRIPRLQIITVQEILDGTTISKTGIQPIGTTQEGKPLAPQHPELGLGS